MFSFLKLAGEKIKLTLEETIDNLSDKKEEIIESLSTTKDKVISSIKTGKDKFIDVISTTVGKVKEKLDNNNERTPDYEKEKYEAMGKNTIYTSDENWGICPITQTFMENPVITPSGTYYDKNAILDWIKRNPTDPITREKLTPDMLIEDHEYKRAIQEYKNNIQNLQNMHLRAICYCRFQESFVSLQDMMIDY